MYVRILLYNFYTIYTILYNFILYNNRRIYHLITTLVKFFLTFMFSIVSIVFIALLYTCMCVFYCITFAALFGRRPLKY